MAVKKIKKDEKKSKITSKTDDTKMGRISYKELSEELKLKLKQSEEKIAELNQKYKKVVDIQKKKIEDKYKKIIEDLESKKSIPAKTSSASNNAEINKLQKRLEKLEKTNQKLEEEKRKIELKNEELKQKAKEALKAKNESTAKTIKTDKESLKEIKELKQQLLESEQEKKELKAKLKEAVADLKNAQKNTNKLSKEDKEQYKENLRILKQIEKESKALDKKRELLKKEEEKLKEIRGDIKSSAKDIASTMKKSYVASDDDIESESGGDLLSNMDAKTEEGITKLATLLCAAMDDYREQKEKEREELEKANEADEEVEAEVKPIISEGEDRLNKASEQLENLVENRLEDSDSTKDENLGKRPFTIIDKIENSRVEINEGYTPPAGGQTIVAAPQDAQQTPQQAQGQQPNITVKVEAPKESAKLAKPETQLKPASETPTMRMKLLDDIDDYEKKLVITYGFDNMPENTYYSKYKKILRNAARISLFGNLQEGLEMFKLIRDQNIPDEYKQMIDKNIQDITYYLRGLHRVRME